MSVFKSKKLALSDDIVIKIRTLYFIEEKQYKSIQKHLKEKYSLDITIGLLQKAVKGYGGYAAIKDDIPQEKKDRHTPAHIKYSIKKAKSHYYTSPAYAHLKQEREAKALYRKSMRDNARYAREMLKGQK